MWFNSILLSLSAFFALGIVWQWRAAFMSLPIDTITTHQTLTYSDFSGVKVVSDSATTTEALQEDQEQGGEEVVVESDSEKSNENNIEQEQEEISSNQIATNETTAFNELQGIHEGVVINLDVPYTSQAPERKWEQPWQDACEEVSLLMLDAYYKGYGLSPLFVKDEVYKMVADQDERGWGYSIPIKHIQRLYNEYFYGEKKAHIVLNPTINEIKTYIDNGTPVLAVAYGKSLPNKWYSNGGPEYHALIIRGYTEDSFITNDPGVNRGRNFKFPINDLMNSIHDWNDGDVQNGQSAILVLQ